MLIRETAKSAWRPGFQQGGGGVRSGSVQTLKLADAHALRALPGVAAVAPEMSSSAQLRYQNQNQNASVVGVTPEYFDVRALPIASGISLSALDDERRARVAVLGANLAEELYGKGSPLGSRLQVNGNAFRVIGVLAAKGSGMGSPDDSVFVPSATHQSALFGRDYLSNISLQLSSEEHADQVLAQATQLLRLRHRLRRCAAAGAFRRVADHRTRLRHRPRTRRLDADRHRLRCGSRTARRPAGSGGGTALRVSECHDPGRCLASTPPMGRDVSDSHSPSRNRS